MSKWLAKFLDDMPGNSTDKPDTLLDSDAVSVMSVPIPGTSAEISGLHPNDGDLISSPSYPQQDADGGHSEDIKERQPDTLSDCLAKPIEVVTDKPDTLATCLDETPEDGTDIPDSVPHILDETPRITTDKPDILAEPGTVSVLSVPVSGIPTEISATQADGSPLVPPPQYPQNPQKGSGVELGPLPEPPVKAGWLVAYRRYRRDRVHDGIVDHCAGDGHTWTVQLTNGAALPLKWVTSIGKTDAQGQVVGAWEVERHGFDGERGAS